MVEVAPQYDATSNTAQIGAQMLFELFCLTATALKARKGLIHKRLGGFGGTPVLTFCYHRRYPGRPEDLSPRSTDADACELLVHGRFQSESLLPAGVVCARFVAAGWIYRRSARARRAGICCRWSTRRSKSTARATSPKRPRSAWKCWNWRRARAVRWRSCIRSGRATGPLSAAEALIRRMVALDPNNVWATQELALLLFGKGDFAEAEAACAQCRAHRAGRRAVAQSDGHDPDRGQSAPGRRVSLSPGHRDPGPAPADPAGQSGLEPEEPGQDGGVPRALCRIHGDRPDHPADGAGLGAHGGDRSRVRARRRAFGSGRETVARQSQHPAASRDRAWPHQGI